MHEILVKIGSFIVAGLMSLGLYSVPIESNVPTIEPPVNLGADTTLPFAGTYYTLAGSGVSGSGTSIVLTSLTVPQTGYEIQDSDLSSTFYMTLEPGSRTRQEIISCTTVTQSGTDNTATLSGCTRGLLPFSPYTASSSYQFAHAGGTYLIFSNSPQFYNELAGKTNDETITGTWSFSTFPLLLGTPTATSSATNKNYVDAVVNAGAADATDQVEGIVMFSTQSQLAAGTATSSASSTFGMAPQNRFFSATPSATTTGVITGTGGTIAAGFIATSSNYTWSGTNTHTGTNTFSGLTSLSSTTIGGTSSTISSTNLNIKSGTTTFDNIPILPSSNPITANQATRKAYTDTKTTGFSTTTAIVVGTDYFTATSGIAWVTFQNQAGQVSTLTFSYGLSTSTYATVSAVVSGATTGVMPFTFPILPNYWYKSSVAGTGASGGAGLFFPFSY